MGQMDSGWAQFLSENASAIFALIGALGGAVLSFIGALLLKKRDFSLATGGKLLDRRIAAHESVAALATEMRSRHHPIDFAAAGRIGNQKAGVREHGSIDLNGSAGASQRNPVAVFAGVMVAGCYYAR